MQNHEYHQPSESNRIEYFKFIAVIAGIAITSTLAFTATENSSTSEFIRLFMGVFLLVFAGFKFAGYKMFVMMFQGYDLLAKRSTLYSQAYPFIELLLGLAFIANIWPTARSIAILFIMGVGTVGVMQEIYFKRSGVHCACLGNIIKLPLSTVSLVENVTMVGMAAYMLLI